MQAVLAQYLSAREEVISQGHGGDLDAALEAASLPISEPRFLENLAWVILAAGFSESVLSRRFPNISAAFGRFRSAGDIIRHRKRYRRRSLREFNNARKTDAIIEAAERVDSMGFAQVLEELDSDPIAHLQGYPMIGPVTSFHLAKNLGYAVAKPDRHVQRIADRIGFRTSQQMCQYLSEWSGDPIVVVDVVLWRYAAITPTYLSDFGPLLIGAAGSGITAAFGGYDRCDSLTPTHPLTQP